MYGAAAGTGARATRDDGGMRLVASDLDGTVVGPDGEFRTRTLSALAACVERGIEIVFVTGRPTRWMPPIAAATGHRGLAICSNGAVLYDLGSEQVLGSQPLVPEVVHDVVQLLRSAFGAELGEPSFALETLRGFRREPGYLPRHEVALAAPIGSISELLDDDPGVIKVLCRTEVATSDAMLAVARVALDGVAEPVHSAGAGASARPGGMLEISALGVSKASALARVAADRGIDQADVVAFGDMPNDVPMLRWAGRGYAMAGGHPEAIAAADAVAPPFDQDGVAQVLEALLDGR